LRAHVADRRKFFDAKERLQKVKSIVAPDDGAADLDRKMIAVVAKAEQPELFNIVRTLFHAWTEAGNEIELDSPPAVWSQIEKFDLDAPFWQMVRVAFGFEDQNPTLKMLLLRLMLTDYAHHLRGDVRSRSGTCSCPGPAGQTPSFVLGSAVTAAARESVTTVFRRMQQRFSRLKIICRTWTSTNLLK
jgi:hypothetical protein